MMEHKLPDIQRPRLFGSRDSRPALLKLWFPLLLWLIAIESFEPNGPAGGFVLVALFAMAGFFLFTLAVIMPTNDNLQYRRFIRWHTINYDEIVECNRSILPVVGYLKLKQFLSPWGKLYFVFSTPSAPFFGRSEQGKVLIYIQDKMAGKVEESASPEENTKTGTSDREGHASMKVCALWAVLGFGWVVLLRLALGFQTAIPTPSVFSHENMLYRLGLAWWKLGTQLLDWPVNLFVVLVLFVVLTTAIKFRRAAWGLAVALGFFLGELFVRYASN